MTLARELVRTLRARSRAPLPETVAAAARLHFVDALGVGLAAAGSSAGVPYLRYASQAPSGTASVFGRASGTTAAEAALINGGLIHSLEFDDTHTASIAHGSSVLAAAALAAGEAAGASGAQLLGAYARGWEVLIRLGLASPGRFQARGFQVTSVAGALAAALAAAEINGLTEDATLAALGISLSQACGVLEFLTNGSSVKSLHPGWAAHAGMVAAALAEAGMTGPETSLEGRFGLFRQFADDPQAAERFSRSLEDLGATWHLRGAAFKFYPCCHYLHPFIEAAGLLAERVRIGEGERILCRVPAGAAPVICEPWEAKQAPATPHAARWSLPLVVAARIVEGAIDLGSFERPASAAVLALAKRISWEPLAGARFPERFEAQVECQGQTVRIDDVYGNTTRPATADAVRAKFFANGGNEEIWSAVHAGRPARDIGAALKRNVKKEAAIS